MKSQNIGRDESYSLEEFAERTGLGKSGLRAARRAGLRVRYCHNRGFVLGADWHDYLVVQSTDAPGPAAGTDPRSRSESEVLS